MWRWKIAWREMRRHRARALLTWLSVVVGVAAVLAVGLSTGSARSAYQQMYQTITGRAALEITAAGGNTLDASLLDQVQAVPGVEDAVPLIQRNSIMYYPGGRMNLIALGIDPARDAAVRDYRLVGGKQLSERGAGILLDASLAQSLNLKVGDRVKLLVRRGFVETTVVGLVQPRSGAAVTSAGVLFMPLAAAQRRFAIAGKLDRIQIVLGQNADPAALQTRLRSLLPVGVQVEPPLTRSSLAEETMMALENGLQLATAFSLLAAVFIIMNTFLMNVGQRRRQLAIMRAIGATRNQIGGLVLGEALVLGIAGTLAGVLIGFGGARLLNQAMSGLFRASLPAITLRPLPLLTAAAFGSSISLLGAWLPARQAARVTPLEGMSGIVQEDFEGHSRKAVVLGLLIFVMSVGMLVASVAGWLPLEFSVEATVTLLISLVLLLPLALRPLTWLGEKLLQPAVGVETRLARRQLLRHHGRTTLTIGVLFVAVATGLGLANSVVDNVQDVRRWYRTAIVGDFFVRAAMPDMETSMVAGVPASVGQEIGKIDGVTKIVSIRFVPAKVDNQSVIVVASSAGQDAQENNERSVLPFFPPQGNRVLIGSVLAERIQKKVGDTITLQTRSGARQLRIAAVANDYTSGGLTVHMNMNLAQKLLGVEGADAYVVSADHSRLKAVEDALRTVCAKNGMLLQSYSDLTQLIESMMAGVVGSLWGLLVLGLIVAAFGVINTLGMNVLEQTRELGLLRVVAMTRGQVRKSVVSQAALLGLLGVAPGSLAGVAMAYIINLSTLPVIGHPVAFTLHPWLLLGCFFTAMAMVLVASWIPAERAARLNLAAALRYD